MSKRVREKGFTLTELLVAIVILGIITLMAIPQISNLINSNNDAKYDAYKETIETSAKLYTDSYEEDMFGNNTSGCYDIPYEALSDKKLVQDIKINNVTCSGGSQKKTFVRVYKSGDHYKYKVSILCVNKNNESAVEYSDVIDTNIAGDTTFCDGKTLDLDGPTISLHENGTTWSTGDEMKVRLTIADNFGLLENIKIRYAWTTTPGAVSSSSWKSKEFGNERYKEKVRLQLDVPQNKSEDYYLVVEPVMVRDANGNYQTRTFKSNVFQFDNTKPTCSLSVSGTKGLSDWYITKPKITMTVDDTRGEIVSYTMRTSKITDFSTATYNNKLEKTQDSDTTSVTWYGYVKDAAGNITECKTPALKVDTTPPTKPTGGTLTISGSSTSATMAAATGSTDATSGVKEYRYVIKNSSGAPANTSTSYTTTRTFTRSCGTSYYGYAIAVDNAGNRSKVRNMGNTSDGADSYSSWSGCSKTCGGGTKTRTNTCALVTWDLSTSCNTQDCCSSARTEYGDWSTCTKKCGTGTKTRTVKTYSNYTGNLCSSTTETVNCNTQTCCSSTYVSSYGSWEGCSKTCGGGTEYRDVYYKSNYDGSSCGSTNNGSSRSCNTHSCCSSVYDSYGSYGGCSASCGTGYKYATVNQYSNYNGQWCNSWTASATCNTQGCCSSVYNSYGGWGGCNVSCGWGNQYRTVNQYSNYNGQWCNSWTDSTSCYPKDCCTVVGYNTAGNKSIYCWNFASSYMGGGSNWNNGKLSLCTDYGGSSGCVSATDSRCGKMGGTYKSFKYCP